jgi:hypothetical protein
MVLVILVAEEAAEAMLMVVLIQQAQAAPV